MLWVNVLMFTILNFSFNYLDIAIVILLIFSVINGYSRGFLKTVFDFLSYSIGLFLCFYLSSNLTPVIYDGFVKERVLSDITERIDAAGIETVLANISESLQKLPDFLTSSLDLSVLATGSENAADAILINVLEPIILTVLRIAIYILVFLLFFAATGFLGHLITKSSKRRDEKRGHMTKLKKSDKAVGAIIGIFNSFVLVLALDAVLNFFSDIGFTNEFMMTQFSESVIVELLSNINPFNAVTEGLV